MEPISSNPALARGTYKDYLDFKQSGYKELNLIRNKQFIFVLTRENDPNGVVADPDTGRAQRHPLAVSIPMVGHVLDEKTGTIRKIRFVQGERSIFADEQSPDDKVKKKQTNAVFKKGRMIVRGTDPLVLRFMMESDKNESKDGRDTRKPATYRLLDRTKQLFAAREIEKAKIDVVNWCLRDATMNQLLAVATEKLTVDQLAQPSEEIRWDLKIIAERDPVGFQKILDDPKTERRYVVRQAKEMGKVVIDQRTNSLHWSDNPHTPISSAVPGKDPITDFVEKSFTPDGEKYYESMYGLVNPRKVERPVIAEPAVAETRQEPVIQPPALSNVVVTESDAELGDMYDKMIAAGKFVPKGPVWIEYVAGVAKTSFKKKNGFIEKMRKEPVILESVKYDLQKLEQLV